MIELDLHFSNTLIIHEENNFLNNFKVGLKNSAEPHFFNPLLSVWKC